MKSARPHPRLLHLLVACLLLFAAAMTAHAQGRADPPSRVGRLNHAEGAVAFAPAGDNEWIDAARNRPLVRGDKLWTDKGSRAEVQVGSSALRLDGLTHVEILALDDQTAQLSVAQGTVYLRVRSLPEGENYEIDTPNLAYRAAYPGDYRIDVDAARGTTRVTIHSGTGTVYGDGGQVQALGGGQQVMFRDKNLAQVAAQESPPQDNFDRWAAERNRREDQSISARYVPREVVGYQELDANGQWSQDAAHGVVWTPRTLPANWAPYRNGRWEWIAPWGWTWIDDAPWGFAPFHYGRWTQINSRWAWVPGRIGLKPVYAPALVAFIGGSGAGWKSALGPGRSGVTWFPLAPGEPWIPAHPASPVYMSNVNRDLTMLPNAPYAFQRNPDALSALGAEDFHRGKPVRAGWMQVAANLLTSAQIVPPPAMPQRGSAEPVAAATRASPPPAVDARPVVASATPAAVQAQAQALAVQKAQAQTQARVDAEARQQAQAKADAQARADAQAKIDAQAKADAQARLTAQAESQRQAQEQQRAQQARREQQASRAEAAKREHAARRAETAKREQIAERESQARRAETTRRTDQARRRDELAKRELARKEQVARQQLLAKRAEKQRLELQARKAEQAKRDAAARREEQQRRDLHDQHVAQARKAADQEAQALREARAKREEAIAKREAQEREQAQREAAQREVAQREAALRQQQALAEQWRRDRAAWEQQQRERSRGRPDLREADRRNRSPESRGFPIIGEPMS